MVDWMKTPEQLQQERIEREQEALARQFTYKTDVWMRMTNDEADQIEAVLETAPARQRGMWRDSITIEHSSPWFAELYNVLVENFSQERADIILAPSEQRG